MGIPMRVGWRPNPGTIVPSVDADATAFIAAAGITNLTQASAINTLVTQLKTYGIWSKMKAIYPFVGGTASAHKFNLKDPRDLDATFRLQFNGGWTHSSTGALPNGSTGYADTKLIPSSILTSSNLHISYYSRTDSVLPDMMGLQDDSVNNGSQIYFQANKTTEIYSAINTDANSISVSSTNTTGYYVVSRITSTNLKAYKNGSQVGSNVSNSTSYRANIPMYLGAFNYKHPGGASLIQYGNKECAFGSIGDGLSDTEAANFYTAVQTFQTTLGRQVGVPIVADTDAQAFINAAVITNATQANAINTLVTDLKSANLWSKMKAIYPFVGGTASAHKWNLKDPRDLDAAYRLTFNGGGIHSSTGYAGNASNAWANTYLNAQSVLTNSNLHLSFYSRTASTAGTYSTEILSNTTYGTGASWISLRTNNKIVGGSYFSAGSDAAIAAYGNTLPGFVIGSETSSTLRKFYYNGNSVATNTTYDVNALPSAPITLLGYIDGANSGNESAFASIGDGLSDTEAASFYTAVQKYQTSLGRHIGTPIVSDTDAQAFINAAVITNTTQANAINTLVTDLKSANIWTKMKAIYPFVGGTASSHKFNLKDARDLDAAFRLVFNGGWTHSATGAKPNGTTGYADTKFNLSTNLPNAVNSNHISLYVRENIDEVKVDMGIIGTGVYLDIESRISNIGYYGNLRANSAISFSNTDSRGLHINTRTTNTLQKVFINTTLKGSDLNSTSGTLNGNISLAARYNLGNGLYEFRSSKEQAFASIGDGLSDAETAAFYTAVQKYQTSLSRAV